ncbi:MAG: hypothetical protein J6V01_06975 [Clostridia bacterium]|nr:hypothetical protein [Clostridia bacterium]
MNAVTRTKRFLSGKGKPLGVAVSLIPALVAAYIMLYYIWGPAEGYFHSDCTDNLLWADVSVDTGRVFDETFRYAGMLPFSATVWMIPLVRAFGVSMIAQNIGMSVFALIYLASVLFFCRSAGFGTGWSSLASFASVCAMSASDKLREIMYGHNIYYSIGPCVLFFLLGLILRMSRRAEDPEQRKTLWAKLLLACSAAAVAALSAGAATDGSQVIVIGTLPAVAGVIAERFFSRERLLSKKNLSVAFAAGLFAVGTLAGMILLKIWKGDIECGYAEAYSGWSDIGTWADNARAFVKQYFTLIGVSPKGSLFSFESVVTMLRMLGGVMIIAVPVVMFFFYKRLSGPAVRALLWGHTVVFCAVTFGFVCGKLSGANWRLTPILATGSALCVAAARELFAAGRAKPDSEDKDEKKEDARGGSVPVRVGALLIASVLCFSAIVSLEILKMPADYGRDNYRHQLAAFLEEKGLEYGYATFWQSQAITALSDSRVRCREILTNDKNGVYTDYYQSSRRWYTGQNYEKYFVLLSDAEYAKVRSTESWLKLTGSMLIAEYTPDDGLYPGFRVFVFSGNPLDQQAG